MIFDTFLELYFCEIVFITINNIIIFTLGTSKGQKRRYSSSESTADDENETLNEQFRRGKDLNELGVEWGENSENGENSVDPPDEMNDTEWNMLGAALEKEFLQD